MNSTAAPEFGLSQIADPSFGQASPSHHEQVVNALWFTSLAVSLSTALLTVLVKQWLVHYTRSTSGTARERARTRQFRYAGLVAYHVPLIVDLLPIFLLLALALFMVGLTIFLSDLHVVTASIVGAITGVSFLLYFTSVYLSVHSPQCPYKSPLSFYAYRIYHGFFPAVSRGLHHLNHRAAVIWKAACRGVQRVVDQPLASLVIQPLHQAEFILLSTLLYIASKALLHIAAKPAHGIDPGKELSVEKDPHTTHTLNSAESQEVRQSGAQLDIDGISWLCTTSTNSSVREIGLEALSGLPPLEVQPTGTCEPLQKELRVALERCTTDGNQVPRPGMERNHDRLLRALSILGGSKELVLGVQHLDIGQENPLNVFSRKVLPLVQQINKDHVSASFVWALPLHFPLHVWATFIQLARQHQPVDHIIRTLLLSTLHLPIDTSDMGAVDLSTAMQNPFIRRLALDYLEITNSMEEDSLALFLRSFQALLSRKNSEDLRDTVCRFFTISQDLSSLHQYLPIFLSRLLPYLFTSLACQVQDIHCSSTQAELMTAILSNFLHSSSIDDVTWETTASALKAWQAPVYSSLANITTPRMLRDVLGRFCGSEKSKDGDVQHIRKTVSNLETILVWCMDVDCLGLAEAILSTFRDMNMLPCDIESMSQTTSLRLFWSPSMCVLMAERIYELNASQQGVRWFNDWMNYVHKPERLTFICQRILPSKAWRHYPHPVEDLCRIQPSNPSWTTCFESLLHIYRHENSRRHGGDALALQERQHIVEQLQRMKLVLQDHHNVLSDPRFDVPEVTVDHHASIPVQGTSIGSTMPRASSSTSSSKSGSSDIPMSRVTRHARARYRSKQPRPHSSSASTAPRPVMRSVNSRSQSGPPSMLRNPGPPTQPGHTTLEMGRLSPHASGLPHAQYWDTG